MASMLGRWRLLLVGKAMKIIAAVDGGRCAVVQNQRVGLRMIGEPNPAEIRYLALVPAKQRPDPRQTRNRFRRLQDPHLEVLLSGQSRRVANFGIVAVRRPGIGELHPAAGLVQGPRFAFEGFAGNQFNPSALHGLDPVDVAVVRETSSNWRMTP